MNLLSMFGLSPPEPQTLPGYIRAVEDVRGVRVLRLCGEVGMAVGLQAREADEVAADSDAFSRPLLVDFADTRGWDSATVSYLVLALRRRMAAHALVGMINAPVPLLAELEISRVKDLFLVFDDEEQAITELARTHPGA